MKNIFRISALAVLCSLIGLVACTREELSTDQFSDDAVVFSAFAPNPVVRGAELRIMGSNLDKIVEVQIPGAEPITEIEVVSSGRVSEIRVVTPAAGAEDESVTGPVVIVDKSGNAYQSKSELTFTEGIVLDSFSPAEAMPGDVVTVKGDYLYNVQQIILEGGVYITGEQILEKTRRELKFVVPSNAVTGPVTIGDVDEADNPDGLIPNNVPSKEVLTIGDPVVRTAARGALKAGAEVTVAGEYLDMIAGAAFGGVAADYTVAEDGKSLVAVLPASAVEGELTLVSYAGKEFKAGAYTTVIPTNVTIAAESRYKAGLNAVISGNDLDLVTSAALAGTAVDCGYSEGKLTFAIPASAVDGTVILTLANGKTVETAAIELVKPVITEVTPLELYAGDENIIVKGEDLDLVTGVTLGGRDAEFTYSDGAVTVVTTLTSVSGKVVFTLANGVTVESADEVKVNYHSKVIVTEMPAMQHIGQEVVLKGSNFSLVENIFIGDVKVTQYSLRTDEEVRFLMPWNKAGMHSISFLLFDGETEVVPTQIEVGLELDIKTLWEGEQHITWTGMDRLSWSNGDFAWQEFWSSVKPGTKLTAYFTQDENPEYTPQIRFGNGNWNAIPGTTSLNGGNILLDPGATYYTHTLTAADLADLTTNGGLVMTGTFYTLTKLTLTSEISQEKTIWEGLADPQNYAVNLELGGPDNSDWRNADLQVGQTIKIYFDLVDPASWSVQVFDAHWGGQVSFSPEIGTQFNQGNWDGSLGYVSFVVTEAIHSAFTSSANWGSSIILQGAGLVYTKITLL